MMWKAFGGFDEKPQEQDFVLMREAVRKKSRGMQLRTKRDHRGFFG